MINDAIVGNSDEFRGYYEKPRTQLLDLIDGFKPGKVLEIGCGAGSNLRELKRRFPECLTVGVELRRDVAEIAKVSRFADIMHVGSVLDSSVINFPHGEFDVIILSHVLEHFTEPEKVIARADNWLAPDGHLLIALPNIRHASVLRELVIQGDFRYRSSGILDHTHFRFFTRKSAVRFLMENGFSIRSMAPDIQGRKSELFSTLTFGFASEFAAFAFNFLVYKTP